MVPATLLAGVMTFIWPFATSVGGNIAVAIIYGYVLALHRADAVVVNGDLDAEHPLVSTSPCFHRHSSGWGEWRTSECVSACASQSWRSAPWLALPSPVLSTPQRVDSSSRVSTQVRAHRIVCHNTATDAYCRNYRATRRVFLDVDTNLDPWRAMGQVLDVLHDNRRLYSIIDWYY